MPRLAFRLKVAGTDEFEVLNAVSTSYKLHGLLWLDAETLVLQWGGEIRIEEVGPLTLRDETEPLPTETVHIPVADLHAATLEGGWLRPHLTLEARTLEALEGIPGHARGRVRLWYARADRFAAIAMQQALADAIAGRYPTATTTDPIPLDDEPMATPPEGIGRGA